MLSYTNKVKILESAITALATLEGDEYRTLERLFGEK